MFEQLLHVRNKKIADTALEFLYDKLQISVEDRKIISISTVKRLGDADGNCQGHYDAYGNLKNIHINIKSHSSIYAMIDTLAHELVHAKQHLRGDFGFAYIKVPFLFFFEREVFTRTYKGKPLIHVPYYEQESEQEAFTKSNELVIEFCSKLYNTTTDSIESYNTEE